MDQKEQVNRKGRPLKPLLTANLEKGTMDLISTNFMANGHKYIITDELSLDGWTEGDKFRVELLFGVEFETMVKAFKDIWMNANQQNFGSVCVIAYNQLDAASKMLERDYIHPAMKLCTCFIYREDEDRRYFSKEMMMNKINDWKEEGIIAQHFFTLAISFIPNFRTVYEKLTQDISQMMNTKTVLQTME